MSSENDQNFSPVNHIEAALKQGTRDLQRLSAFYRVRGKNAEADEIDRVVLEFAFNRGDRFDRPAA